MKFSLKEFIQEKYLEGRERDKIAKMFRKDKPFPHFVLKDFFLREKIIELLKGLSKEKLYEKESDLFKFMQSNDLNFSSCKEIKEFRDFLISNDFISYLSDITGFKLKKGKIDLFGSVYQDTDYLLCHDDKLEGRKIAFNVYLSNFKENEGGSLNLFASNDGKPLKIEKEIISRFNTFAIFEVSEKSFHEVSEVVVNKQRIALSGWYYEAFFSLQKKKTFGKQKKVYREFGGFKND